MNLNMNINLNTDIKTDRSQLKPVLSDYSGFAFNPTSAGQETSHQETSFFQIRDTVFISPEFAELFNRNFLNPIENDFFAFSELGTGFVPGFWVSFEPPGNLFGALAFQMSNQQLIMKMMMLMMVLILQHNQNGFIRNGNNKKKKKDSKKSTENRAQPELPGEPDKNI